MDHLVVVGGPVPSLLIEQDDLPAGASPHAGTMDLDIGLDLAMFDDRRYRTLTDRSLFLVDRFEPIGALALLKGAGWRCRP